MILEAFFLLNVRIESKLTNYLSHFHDIIEKFLNSLR